VTSRTNDPSWKPVIVFLIYGMVLFAAGLMLSGMGEGANLGFIAFGSPVSVTGLVFSILAVWLLFGFLLGANLHGWAAALLITHYVVAPVAVMLNHANRSWEEEWALFMKIVELDPATAVVLLLIYASGQILAWYWIIAGISHSRTA
jgi:hypothetical protein